MSKSERDVEIFAVVADCTVIKMTTFLSCVHERGLRQGSEGDKEKMKGLLKQAYI